MQFKTCSKCKENLPTEQFGFANKAKGILRGDCKNCRAQYSKTYREQNDERIRSNKRNYHIQNSAKNNAKTKAWVVLNPERKNTNARNYARRQRSKVLTLLGMLCVCCGEDEVSFLDIHHTDHNGASHRKQVRHMGTKYYNEMLKNPHGLAILCCNCNLGSARNQQICPHVQIMPKQYSLPSVLVAGDIQCKKCHHYFTREGLLKDRHVCKNCDRLSSRRKDAKLQDDCFNAYGGYICACCGETQKLFLCIDHLNNDGAMHRKEIGNGGNGRKLYSHLRKNNFPPGFQVLCANCNHSKMRNKGACKHLIQLFTSIDTE